MKRTWALFTLLLLGFSGCATYQVNPPIDTINPPTAYSFNNIVDDRDVGENFFMVTLSGGGMRAAAFAYGVLEYLNRVEFRNGESTLLESVDVISSVSGGSYAAGYFGAFGQKKFLKDFPKDVLYRNVSGRMGWGLMMPWNILRIMSPHYDRSDYTAEILDKMIFKGKTIGDIPLKWPFIVINSTDLSRGIPFSFVQGPFNRICSDVSKIKIARAVMASSAFPGPFTPLTFKNYPKETCGYETPAWIDQALQNPRGHASQRFIWATDWKSYEDSEDRPYIHLFDGGVADNLGIKPLIEAVRTGRWNFFADKVAGTKLKRIVMIVVDAKPARDYDYDRRIQSPKLFEILHNAAVKPLRNYSVNTVQNQYQRFRQLKDSENNFKVILEQCDRLYKAVDKRKACYERFKIPFGGVFKPPYPEPYLIHVHFRLIQNSHPELSERLATMRTNLNMDKKNVELIANSVPLLFEQSTEFQELLDDINAYIPPSNTVESAL